MNDHFAAPSFALAAENSTSVSSVVSWSRDVEVPVVGRSEPRPFAASRSDFEMLLSTSCLAAMGASGRTTARFAPDERREAAEHHDERKMPRRSLPSRPGLEASAPGMVSVSGGSTRRWAPLRL